MNTKNVLLTEAIRIGDNLLEKAAYDEAGNMYWKSMHFDSDNQIQWVQQDSLYNGVAGIVLFLVELYKKTSDKKYLQAVKSAKSWLLAYCQANPTDYYAFFTGRVGTAYTILEVAQLTKDTVLQGQALQLIENCEDFLSRKHQIDDLINGASGTLLGLLHFHQKTGEESLLPKIELFTNHLLKKAKPGQVGLYWDRTNKSIRGLCGFSHGASGPGYVFLELGNYFQVPAYSFIARQAFLYENHFFNEEHSNWPDFRKGIFDTEMLAAHKAAYANSDFSFFCDPGYMAAWCHGAPGIGLARLRAYELLQESGYKQDAMQALKTTQKVYGESKGHQPTYTLCHGGGGNAMLFLEAYKHYKDEKYLQFAQEVALDAIHDKKTKGMYYAGFSLNKENEDTSLFMGNAGIGYYFLQVLDPDRVPSVVRPDVGSADRKPNYPPLNRNISELKEGMIMLAFPKTLNLLQKQEAPLADILDTKNLDDSELLNSFSLAIKDYLKDREVPLLKDVFEYELFRFKQDSSVKSSAYLHIKREVEAEKNKLLLTSPNMPSNIMLVPLQLAPEVSIKETRWDWLSENGILQEDEERAESLHKVLLISTPEGILETKINDFTYCVLTKFTEPIPGKEAFLQTAQDFDITSEDEKEILHNAVVQQIVEALKSAILLQALVPNPLVLQEE